MQDKHDNLKQNPFTYKSGNDRIIISYDGKIIKTLKGLEAAKTMNKLEAAGDYEKQMILAKITGHFKH